MYFQRATGAEREVERLRKELSTGREQRNLQDHENLSRSTEEQAMDILQRSSLEVELAAKEKEVRVSSLYWAALSLIKN